MFLFGVRIVISFSMRFKILLRSGWSWPRAVNIPRRLFMSAVLNILVSMAAVRCDSVNMLQVEWEGLKLFSWFIFGVIVSCIWGFGFVLLVCFLFLFFILNISSFFH